MRVWAMIQRIVQQMFRDKRTLGLLFLAPLLIMTLLHLVFNGETVRPILGVNNVTQKQVEQLEKAEMEVKSWDIRSDIEEMIKEHDLDGFLDREDEKIILTLLNDDPTKSKSLQMKVEQVMRAEQLSKRMDQKGMSGERSSQPSIETKYVYGNAETNIFDVFSPILVGYFVFFFVFLIAGIGLLKERITGTLERLMATPIQRWEIVIAYLLGFGIFAVLQTMIIILFAVYGLDMVVVGSIGNVFIINMILALVALSLGILLSSFAKSEFQMIQFIPIVIVPQVFFSGIFPLEGMVDWLQIIARGMPLYYGAQALVGVMYKGESLAEIIHYLYPLIAFAAVFILFNLFALKKHRKI